MSTKEIQENIATNMRHWQKIENASITQCGEIAAQTKNPIVRTVMEIIKTDSQRHHQVQELIASSLESTTISISPEEIGEVWDMIQKHIDMEKKTETLARESLEALKGKKMLVQEYLLRYLLEDETKLTMQQNGFGIDFNTLIT